MKTLILIVLLTSSVLGCGATSFVKGQVTVNGWPASRARVLLVHVEGGGIEGTATTSSFGFYQILAGPCPSRYVLRVRSKYGLIFSEPTIWVDGSGRDTVVDIIGQVDFVGIFAPDLVSQ